MVIGDISADRLRLELKCAITQAFGLLASIHSQSEQLSTLGFLDVDIKSGVADLANSVTAKYFHNITVDLAKQSGVTSTVGIVIDKKSYDYFSGLRYLSLSDTGAFMSALHGCLNNIQFSVISDSIVTQYHGLDDKQKSFNAERLHDLLGFQYHHNGMPRTTKSYQEVIPSFYVSHSRTHSYREKEECVELTTLFRNLFSEHSFSSPLSEMLNAYDEHSCFNDIPNQKFIGSDLTIDYQLKKHRFLFSHQFMETICAYICLYGSEPHQQASMNLMTQINNRK